VMISNKKSMLSYGTPFLEEKIGEFTFRISPESFFQTNTAQARVLYEKISEMVDLSSSDTLLDLYCGTGSIGLFLSKKVNRIVGIEENSQAIENANENAKINSIPNASFLCGSVQNMLKTFTIKPDVVILDPPRSGMVPKAIVRLLDLKAPRMVYVSCNPATLFRDLKDIAAGGYHIEAIQPVDMFPNTFHIELIIKLKLQKNFQ